jgi:hypothetical protein
MTEGNGDGMTTHTCLLGVRVCGQTNQKEMGDVYNEKA